MTGSKMKVMVVSVAFLATSAVRVLAHHSFGAVFDATKQITLRGTVTKVERMNPHGWIYLDVKQPDGTIKNWVIETGTPQELARRGLLKETIPIGRRHARRRTLYHGRSGQNVLRSHRR